MGGKSNNGIYPWGQTSIRRWEGIGKRKIRLRIGKWRRKKKKEKEDLSKKRVLRWVSKKKNPVSVSLACGFFVTILLWQMGLCDVPIILCRGPGSRQTWVPTAVSAIYAGQAFLTAKLFNIMGLIFLRTGLLMCRFFAGIYTKNLKRRKALCTLL